MGSELPMMAVRARISGLGRWSEAGTGLAYKVFVAGLTGGATERRRAEEEARKRIKFSERSLT